MNNDLISRSALIAALENEKIRIAIDKVKMFGLIEAAPAVDAVEVVKCGKCWHRDPEDKRCEHHMNNNYFTRDDDGFCSYGERRDDGT